MFKKFCLGILTIAMNLTAFGQGGFVENKGQVLDLDQNFRPEVQFYYQQNNTALYFQNSKVVYSFVQPDFIDESRYANNVSGLDSVKKTRGATHHRLDMEFLNSNENVTIKRGDKSDGLIHFYLNKRNGIRDVGTFSSIIYENIYENIDIIFYQQKTGIKYDIVLREGANLKDVQIKYLGTEKLSIENGKLIIQTNYKTLEEDIPFSYINGDKKSEIKVHYQLNEDGVLSFDTKEKGYSTLTIDPVLEWATYLNGSAVTTDALEYSTSHLDAAGNYYIYGMCYSAANNYPVTNPGVPAYAVSYNASADLYLAKFDPNRTLVWSTYLGGAGFEENYGTNNITTYGNVLHIVAERISQSAPFVNGGGFYIVPVNDNQAAWARFNLTTGQLLHLTGIGGLRRPSIELSSAGNVAISAHAYSFDNPYLVTRAGAYNQATNGGSTDMFFMLFSSAFAQTWGTYLGGPGPQENFMCRFDNSNNIFFIGETQWFGSSTPITERLQLRAGAYYQSVAGGGSDISLGMFNTSGGLAWHTLYGGDKADARWGQSGGYAKLLIDPTTQELLMFWNTTSTNLPVLNGGGGAHYKTVPTHPLFLGNMGGFDNYAAYFARFSSAGALSHASYWFNSTGGDKIHGVTFGGCNKLYIVGNTDFATATLIPVAGGFNLSDGFAIVMQLDRSSLNAEWSSGLTNEGGFWPNCAGRVDNPRVYVSAKGYYDLGPTVDPGGGAYYQANNVNGASGPNFMIWQLHPTNPPIITGTTTICQGQTTTLTASAGAGVPYEWYTTPSGGAPFFTGAVYTTPALFANATYYVSSGTGLCISSRTAVTVNATATTPTQPSAIAGTSSLCAASSQTYSVTNVAGVTYAWSYSGSGSPSSTTNSVTFTPTTSGTLSVTAANLCGSSSASTFAISVAATVPAQPSVITGSSAVCTASSQTYGVTNVAGVTYAWSYSGSGTASSSTNSVTFNPTTSGTLSVTATNACGTSTASTFAITVAAAAPAQPSAISGTSSVCTASSQTYSVTNVAGVTYSWSYSGGGTATSSTNSVTFNPTTSGTLSVTAANACGTSTSSTFAIAVAAAAPAQPSAISGTSSVCTASSQTYSVTNVAGVTYAWSYSGTGTATSSTNSVTFTPTTSGTLSVTATNACGTSTSSTIAINVAAAVPSQPSAITGTTAVCTASSQTYNVTNVAGVTYSWSYSGGGTATSSSNSVTFNPTTSGTLSVTATNACGTSTTSTFAINVAAAVPSQPSAITGTTAVCTASSQTYSVTNVVGVTYAWFYSGTGTATSSTNSVTFTPTTSGTLSVTATNACGTSTSSTIAIAVAAAAPAQPSAISGTSSVCTASSQTYNVTNVAGVTYSWSYSGGGTVTSSTNSVTFNPTTSGTLSVTATNACGTSTSSTLAVNVVATAPLQPSVISGTNTVCNASAQTYNVTNVAGVTYSWSYSGGGTPSSTTNSVTFNPTTSGTLSVTATNACGASTSSTFAITVDAAVPLQPNAITGSNNVCTATSQTFSVTNVAGVTYSWSYSGGGTATSSSNTVTFNPTTSGTLSVTATNTCGTSTSSSLLINVAAVTPAQPSVISGTSTVCAATSETYSITNVAGLTYSWSYSGGGTPSSTTNSVSFIPTTSGTLTLTATNACGTSTSTLAITVGSPASTAGTLSGTQTVCVGSTTAFASSVAGGTWSSSASGIATVNAATGLVTGISAGSATMTYTVSGTGGCASASDTRTVTVDPAPNAGTLSGIQDICSGTTTTFTASIAGGTWSSTDIGIATVDAAGVATGVAQGTATINYTIAGGGSGSCPDAVASRTINVSAPPISGTLSGTQNICIGATATLASTSTGGTWTSSNLLIATVEASTGVVTGIASGSATITYTVAGAGGCQDASSTLTITVTAAPIPGTLSGIQDLCSGTTSTVSSSAPGGTWSSSDITVATINSSGVISAIAPGATTIIYFVAGNGGCPNDSVYSTINVDPSPSAPTVTTSTGNTTICSGESADIIASGSGVGAQYTVFSAATNGTNLGTTPLTVSPANTTTYYVEATATNACINVGGRSPIVITVNQTPNVSAGSDQSVCSGTAATLTASGAPTFIWNTTQTTATISVSPTAATTYSVIGTSALGCQGFDTVTVNIVNIGTILAVNDNFNAESEVEITLNVLENDTYTNVDVTISTAPSNGTATVNLNGSISYTSNVGFGGTDTLYYTICDVFCSSICSSAMVILTVKEEIVVVVSGGFSPNDDGANDVFNIVGIEQYPENVLSIYNRWGSLVYQASPYTNDWNGNSNVKNVIGSDKLTTGTYLYILELNATIEPIKGTLELKRE